MKKIFTKLMLLAVAATALASCAIDDTNDVTTLPGVEVSINATTADVSRSAFGDYNTTDKTYPTLWEGNEDWAITVNERYGKLKNSDITFSEDGKTANAKRTFDGDGIAAADTYTLYLVSPYEACNKPGATSTLTINAAQTPSTTSCDPKAQVLVATSTAEGNPYFETTFHHATAYGKFSFVNLNLNGAAVQNITIESEVAFVNKFTYAFDGGTLTDAGASKVLTLATDATENLWFACAPVDLQGKKLTFTISTDKGPLSKEVTMSTGKGEFKPGVVATFNINMEGIEFDKSVKYELVTDASELAVGDEIIIAAASANYAISTNQKSSNRGATTITKKDNTIVDPNDAVQIITVEAGTKANTFAFNVGDGKYLYASSSGSNQLKTTSTKNDNASWAITIADGKATIVAQGTYTRNNMRYNPNNNDPLFACYAEGSTTGTLTSIYKLPNTKPAILASNIEVDEFGVEDETASYDVKNMEDDVTVQSVSADWVTASASEKTINYSVESNYDGETRTAQIVLASASTGVTKTITVTQAADKFAVSVTAITLDAEKGANATFTVTSSYEYSVSNPDSSKLSVVKGDNGVITVTASTANELAEELSIGNIVVSRSVDTKTLKVAVSQKAAGAVAPVEKSAALSFADKAQRTSFSTSKQVWSQNGVTFTNDKSSSTSNIVDYANPVRLYANSKVTVTAPGKISKIVFDAYNSSYATALKNSIGTPSGATVSVSSDKVTVTYSSAVESVVVAKLSAQVRLDSITVTYLQ